MSNNKRKETSKKKRRYKKKTEHLILAFLSVIFGLLFLYLLSFYQDTLIQIL